MKGELCGLIELCDEILFEMVEEFGEIFVVFVDVFNEVYNNLFFYLVLQMLMGCNIGFNLNDQYNFIGVMILVVVDVIGGLVSCIDIDFDVGMLLVDGGVVVVIGMMVIFLVMVIDIVFGVNGLVSFINGVLSVFVISVVNGIVFFQDEMMLSDCGGCGFFYFFGLNDLVDVDCIVMYEIGMMGVDMYNFVVGQEMMFDIVGFQGQFVILIIVVIVVGESFNDLIVDFNDIINGVGCYVIFLLDLQG